MVSEFRYDNVEERKHGGKREIRRVTVRGASGQKSVTTVMRGGGRGLAPRWSGNPGGSWLG